MKHSAGMNTENIQERLLAEKAKYTRGGRKNKTGQYLHISTKRNTRRLNQRTVKFVLQGMEVKGIDRRST